MIDALIRRYYACFNERRFRDAASLFANDALLEHIPFGQQSRGIDGYVRFATAWLAAFPDGTFALDRVERRTEMMFEVHLLATGTHLGIFDIGIYQFKPTSRKATLRLRELLSIRDEKIYASTLSFDLNDLISQLSTVDYTELTARLERVRRLHDELLRAEGDAARERDVADRLGPELDAARRALRPHYNRERSP
jgi:predicted ester cyclase